MSATGRAGLRWPAFRANVLVMGSRVISLLTRPGLLRAMILRARLAFRLIREPRVRLLVKLVPLAAIVYVLSPIDLIPDVLPAIGELDDLVSALIAIEVFVNLCPPQAVAFHTEALAEGRPYSPMDADHTIIDAEWRRES